MGTGTSCMETGFGNEESQGLSWKGRIVAGAKEIQAAEQVGGNKGSAYLCTSLSTTIRMPSEIQTLLL